MDRIKKIESSRKTPVLSLSQFLNEDNGFQIKMEDFDAELASSYKEISGNDMSSTIANSKSSESSDGSNETGSVKKIEELAKKLREKGVPSVESDDFIKKGGQIKSYYPSKFVDAWIRALDESDKNDSYFFYDGGLYWMKSKTTSLRTPSNWPKWKSSVEGSLDRDNLIAFANNYTSNFGTFGWLPENAAIAAITDLRKSKHKTGNEKFYNVLDGIFTNPIPFITKSDVTKIADFLNTLFDDDNWGWDEYATFSNIMVMIGNLIFYNPDSDRFQSVFRWICENTRLAKKSNGNGNGTFFSDLIAKGPESDFDEQILVINGKGGKLSIDLKNNKDIEDYPASRPQAVPDNFKSVAGYVQIIPKGGRIASIKAVISKNADYLVNHVYPAVKTQLIRMNAKDFASVPEQKYNRTIEIK